MSELYGLDRRGLLNKEDPSDPEREFWEAVPILRTKLNGPRLTPNLLVRNRLLEHLKSAIDVPLTIITAPAGYGKSVLASQWAERHERRVAWLSLDEYDSDLRLFLTSFVAAVDSVLRGACPSTLELTRAPELPHPERIGRSLVNELSEIERPYTLVLDDYHTIKELAIHEFLVELLRYPPLGLRLVLIARHNPLLPLSHWRGRGQMTEIRMNLKLN